jgi:1-aminocyclopropane-1-carboxylate deaminase/D-cysteine desulfhydrase-like pyridoxal-dependent ACC family enzyme
MTDFAAARRALAALPTIEIAPAPTPVEELVRLRAALGGGPRLFVKRDDALPFAFGGNKVRKLRLVLAEARAHGADTLVTAGSVQSNHCRATAAAAAREGVACVLVLSGEPPPRPTANLLLDELFGAEVRYVPRREDRAAAMAEVAETLRRAGRRPYVIPVGASTPLGAAAYALAVGELADQVRRDPNLAPPDLIIHATSSGGTQAGLVAGCRLFGLGARVVGISADEPASSLAAVVDRLLRGLDHLLGLPEGTLAGDAPPEVDDGFVGGGYGVPTEASRAALALVARTEAIVLDPTYTAKAMAGLIAYVRSGRVDPGHRVLFWHTGGQVGVFA